MEAPLTQEIEQKIEDVKFNNLLDKLCINFKYIYNDYEILMTDIVLGKLENITTDTGTFDIFFVFKDNKIILYLEEPSDVSNVKHKTFEISALHYLLLNKLETILQQIEPKHIETTTTTAVTTEPSVDIKDETKAAVAEQVEKVKQLVLEIENKDKDKDKALKQGQTLYEEDYEELLKKLSLNSTAIKAILDKLLVSKLKEQIEGLKKALSSVTTKFVELETTKVSEKVEGDSHGKFDANIIDTLKDTTPYEFDFKTQLSENSSTKMFEFKHNLPDQPEKTITIPNENQFNMFKHVVYLCNWLLFEIYHKPQIKLYEQEPNVLKSNEIKLDINHYYKLIKYIVDNNTTNNIFNPLLNNGLIENNNRDRCSTSSDTCTKDGMCCEFFGCVNRDIDRYIYSNKMLNELVEKIKQTSSIDEMKSDNKNNKTLVYYADMVNTTDISNLSKEVEDLEKLVNLKETAKSAAEAAANAEVSEQAALVAISIEKAEKYALALSNLNIDEAINITDKLYTKKEELEAKKKFIPANIFEGILKNEEEFGSLGIVRNNFNLFMSCFACQAGNFKEGYYSGFMNLKDGVKYLIININDASEYIVSEYFVWYKQIKAFNIILKTLEVTELIDENDLLIPNSNDKLKISLEKKKLYKTLFETLKDYTRFLDITDIDEPTNYDEIVIFINNIIDKLYFSLDQVSKLLVNNPENNPENSIAIKLVGFIGEKTCNLSTGEVTLKNNYYYNDSESIEAFNTETTRIINNYKLPLTYEDKRLYFPKLIQETKLGGYFKLKNTKKHKKAQKQNTKAQTKKHKKAQKQNTKAQNKKTHKNTQKAQKSTKKHKKAQKNTKKHKKAQKSTKKHKKHKKTQKSTKKHKKAQKNTKKHKKAQKSTKKHKKAKPLVVN